MDSKQKCSKAAQRLESKKRKIIAFLQLTEDKLQDGSPQVPIKQPKTEGTGESNSTVNNESNTKSLEELRREKHARQKASMGKPKLYLTLEDLQIPSRAPPSFAICPPTNTEPCYLPLFVMDLQHLMIYAMQGNTASYKPRWCKLLRWNKISHVIVLILNDVSVSEYNEFPDSFSFLRGTFEMKVEMVSPSDYGCSVLRELFHVPLSISQLRKSVKDRTRREFIAHRAEMKNIIALEVTEDEETPGNANCISLLDLLLSPQQMIEEHYPLPVCVEKYPDYTYSQEKYEKVSRSSPMFAVDCEMCLTSVNKLEVTRVSVVNEKLEVVYESLVKPHNAIVNYMTRYSGITKSTLKGVTTRLENVQKIFREILPPDAVLCGHSLNGDLHALKMYHPYVIDTSVIYNMAGQRRIKPGLKRLAFNFLQKTIQESKTGHDPSEDASATMELVLLKLQKGADFGDTVLAGLEINQGTKSEEEELTHAVNSMKKTTKEEKDENECRKSNSPMCHGCKNCTQNDESTGESDEEVQTKPCKKCGWNMDNSHSSDTSNKCCQCAYQSGDSQQVDITRMNKKTVFFERPGTKLGRNLCVVCKENNRSVSLVGPDPEFSEGQQTCISDTGCKGDTDSNNTVSFHSTTSDKKTAKLAKKQLCSSFVTVASFHDFTPHCAVEEKKEKLRAMDKHVGKTLKHAPPNSLLCVVLGGHSDPVKSHPALSLVKIAT